MATETYDRIALATEQLNTALTLFLDHQSYPSSITLAGAAEEIFGNELTVRGLQSTLESSFASMAEFHRMLHRTELDRKTFFSKENLARNALKHLQKDKGPTITIDLEESACWMLVRAIQNSKKTGH